MSAHDKARALLDGRFGKEGARIAHQAIDTDPVAKRIYDCAVDLIASLITSMDGQVAHQHDWVEVTDKGDEMRSFECSCGSHKFSPLGG